MSFRRVSILIATLSLLVMFQCCDHVCICDDGEFSEDEDDELSIEIEEDDDNVINVFRATHEWQTVEEGQAIPPGLHVRMNIQTGTREAKLMSEAVTSADKSEEMQDGNREEESTPSSAEHLREGVFEDGGGGGGGGATVPDPGFMFKGDQRRAHYYGHSDRRGIINKRRRVFSQQEVMDSLDKIDESDAELANLPGISYSQPVPEDPSHRTTNSRMTVVDHEDRETAKIDKPLHRDLVEMMQHTKTLTRGSATVPELLQALEELEYHVHHIDNARELNSIGGLVVIVRLLNHTHPEVRSSAAHVIGAATQRYTIYIHTSSIQLM